MHHTPLTLFRPTRHSILLTLWAICALLSSVSRAQTHVPAVVQLGRAALAYDDYVTAIAYFNRAIEARPYAPEAYYWRAVAKFSLDDHAGACTDLDSALHRNPYQAHFYSLRALCHIRLEQFQQAVADYDRALRDQPDDQGMRFNRALCLIELRDTAATRQASLQLLQRYPQWPRAHLLRAQHLLLVADTTRALQSMDPLLQLAPNDAQAWAFKGRYALQQQKNALADSCLTRAIAQGNPHHDLYLARAQARHALGRYGQALADYDSTIALVPQHFVAHYNRALLRSFVGDDNRALEDFDFVLQSEPSNTLATYNRALLRERTGNYRGAIADYTLLLKAYPHFLYGYAARARCYRHLGQTRAALADETRVARHQWDALYKPSARKPLKTVRRRSDKALEQYQQLVEVEAPSARTYFNDHSGRVQHRRVDRIAIAPYRFVLPPATGQSHTRTLYTLADAALSPTGARLSSDEGTLLPLASLTQVLPHDKAEAQALQLLQQSALLWSAAPDSALLLAQQALQAAPTLPYLHYNMGCALAARGQMQEALEAYTQAIALDSHLAEAFYNRAVVHLLLGQPETAAPDLSRAGQLGLFRAYNLLQQARALPKTSP